MHPIKDVADFMVLGGQLVPPGVDHSLDYPTIGHFIDRILEEVKETMASFDQETEEFDYAELVDGFIDTAYVALTGAIRAVGREKAAAVWDAVVDANLAKVDERHGPVVVDDETGKILKPEGWEPPNVEEIVNAD